MDRDLAPCLACRAAVPAAATTCPECGYDVASHHPWRLALGTVGMALTLSLVLAPVGIPLLWRARSHHRAAAGTVTRRDDVAVTAHLATVLRQQLAWSRPADPLAADGGPDAPSA